jgi:hypothetical protein
MGKDVKLTRAQADIRDAVVGVFETRKNRQRCNFRRMSDRHIYSVFESVGTLNELKVNKNILCEG